jgi:hypothetical protein
VHESHVRCGEHTAYKLDLRHWRNVKVSDTRSKKPRENIRGRVRLNGVEHFAGEVLYEPAGRALEWSGAEAGYRYIGTSLAYQLVRRIVFVHFMQFPEITTTHPSQRIASPSGLLKSLYNPIHFLVKKTLRLGEKIFGWGFFVAKILSASLSKSSI